MKEHRMHVKILIQILFCFLMLNMGACHQKTNLLDQNEIASIIDKCISEFKTYYVYPDKVDNIENYLNKNVSRGDYDNIPDLASLTKKLRQDFRKVTDDRHIWIDIMENLPIDDSDATDQEMIKELEKSNFGFVKIDRLSKNMVYLRLDGFIDLKYARETAIEYMQKLADSDIIILDIRENHGGHSSMVHFISSYFFAEKTQLNSLYFTEKDSLATAWTDPDVPGEKLVNQKLIILTSKNTASAAESFAYSMKNYNRASIIGEPTRGAAHWTESFQYPKVGIFLEIPVARPINPVTNDDWERVGVKPDINCPADEALKEAKDLAIRK